MTAATSADSANAVADLLAERSRVVAELQRLAAIDAPILAAEAAVAAVDRAISTLDQAERARTEDWAQSGVGDPPESRNSERAGLVKRRLELQSDVDAARNRAAAVAPRRTALNVEIARIGRELFLRKIREVVAEGELLNEEAHSIVQQALEPLTRLQALRQALVSAGNSQENQGAHGAAREAFNAAEVVGKLPTPQIQFDSSTINRMTVEWQERLR